MEVSATEAKNRLGQMLDHCQREPVVIEKQGRRHSVLLSAAHYDALLTAAKPADKDPVPRDGEEFYARHKHWVDDNNRRVEKQGLWNEELRTW